MKVVVADDEAPARSRLRGLLQEMKGIEVVGEAADGQQTLVLCHRLKPDAVLLDIRMPGMDGLEAARHIAGLEAPPAVVFTTAYSDHALAAFEAHAIDYLLKPVRRERLEEALQRARRLGAAQLSAYRLATAGANTPRTHLSACSRGRIQVVEVDDVLYFQAGDKYVTVRHSGGEILIDEPLKDLEQEFFPRFLRIHRGTLAAKDRITGLEKAVKGQYYVALASGERLPVSRRHVSRLRSWLLQGRAGRR